MSNVPIQLIIAAFKDEDGAENALQQLKQAKKEHLIKIQNAAIIRKDAQGKLHIAETKDMKGGKGALIGGVTGAVLGILSGGATLAITGASALIGGLAAKLRDSGFKDGRLKQLGNSLPPRSSAIVAVIDHIWVAELEQELQQAGADVLTEAISADVAAQLEAGGEAAYTAIASEGGIAAARIVTGAPAAKQDTAAAEGDGGAEKPAGEGGTAG
jgi:uncharacterized membrane protein